jgi:hypothetical protein
LVLFVNSAAASTASRPASVTIASRPSVGWDGGSCRFDLPDGESGIFLQMGLDRANQLELVQQFGVLAQGLNVALGSPGWRCPGQACFYSLAT